MGITIAIIISTPSYRQDLITLFSNRWCRTIPLLFLIALFGCLWSPASLAEKGLVLEKWSKLLYLPILIVGFQEPKTRRMALQAFLVAMLITCTLSLLIHYTSYFHTVKSHSGGLFRNHIMTGIMMSFATYLTGLFFFREQGITRIIYLCLGLLFSYQTLFLSHSRTGYVIYIVLMSVLIIQMFSKRRALIGLICLSAVFASCYSLSQPMQDGVKRVFDNLSSYGHNKDTSIGFRLQFHDYAKHLFQLHPLIGGGTGSFTYEFRTENPVPSWSAASPGHSGRLLEPHSQYWLVAAEFGVLGLIALMLFYTELLIMAYRLDTMRPMALAILLLLAIGNISDSLLFYSGSGYFFILFLALCFSEKTAPVIASTKRYNSKPLNNATKNSNTIMITEQG
ncbi:MAG: O-antigen ligase family protein [Legionellaceae bacterium]|nr:O-antigen ligase family protein [Legionellaceae bacterium]